MFHKFFRKGLKKIVRCSIINMCTKKEIYKNVNRKKQI